MRLQTGQILWFEYKKFHEDKHPIALILFDADQNDNVHAINLNYLPNDLNKNVIDMIARIASRQLNAKDIKKLYHEYMKNRLPGVIARGYRTYKRSEIKNVKLVSNGFNESLSFLHKFKTKLGREETKKIAHTIELKVNMAKAVQRTVTTAKLTPEEAERRAKEYIQYIKKYKPKGTIDWSKHTKV
jgi:hypothetical protein